MKSTYFFRSHTTCSFTYRYNSYAMHLYATQIVYVQHTNLKKAIRISSNILHSKQYTVHTMQRKLLDLSMKTKVTNKIPTRRDAVRALTANLILLQTRNVHSVNIHEKNVVDDYFSLSLSCALIESECIFSL